MWYQRFLPFRFRRLWQKPGARTIVSALAGALLTQELNAVDGLPRSARMVGKALAARLNRYPEGAFGGRVSLAAAVERRTGIPLSQRAVHYALTLLRREGFFVVACCAGEACVGGRHHAARYVAGPRHLRSGWRVRGRFYVREKGATGCTAGFGIYRSLHPNESKEGPSAASDRRSAVENPAREGPQTTAMRPPGPVRLSELVGAWRPGSTAT